MSKQPTNFGQLVRMMDAKGWQYDYSIRLFWRIVNGHVLHRKAEWNAIDRFWCINSY